ncbi:MAG: hypothetical protein NTZ33_11005 [Bacteroidetes bacterium]|nr:hypothetical protein [Bacteroidota bacterium]
MKSKKYFFAVIMIIVGIVALNACKKDVSPSNYTPYVDPYPVGNYTSGLGINPGKPVCKPFILPQNVELMGEIHSATFKSTNFDKLTQNANDFLITPKTTFLELGSGSLVNVYLKLYNKNSVPTTVIIPGGLMFCPGDTNAQTGTTTQNDTIIIPPHDSTGCHIKTYCTNLHKHVPSSTTYSMLGTTLNSELFNLVQILKTKKKLPQGSQVQSIIWHITDQGGMTDADRTYLNSLP